MWSPDVKGGGVVYSDCIYCWFLGWPKREALNDAILAVSDCLGANSGKIRLSHEAPALVVSCI